MILASALTQAIAVVLALAAAVAYPVGTAMQQKANLVQMRRGETGAADATKDVLRQTMWWAGMVVGLLGFVLQGVALSFGALVLVMPILITQLVFMVPAGAWVVGGEMHAHEWWGVALATVGLAVFLVSVRPESGLDSGPVRSWTIATAICGGLFLVLLIVARGSGSFRAALLGAAAGIEAGFLSGILKEATADFSFGNWALYAIAVFGIANVLVINIAIRAGRLSTAQTLIAVVSTIVSFALGLTVFREAVSMTPLIGLLAGAGLVVMGSGTWMLSRSPSLVALDTVAAAADAGKRDVDLGDEPAP